jgi:hypothetical protein
LRRETTLVQVCQPSRGAPLPTHSIRSAVNIERMNNAPSFSKLDVDRVLRRAAEIEGAEDSRPISGQELRSIAGEAGFGAHAVERAIREIRQEALKAVSRSPVEVSGLLVVRLMAHRKIPAQISSEELMTAVRLLQPYREGPAQIKLDADRVHWRDRKGLHFVVSLAGGRTEIKVEVVRPMIRRGRWTGWVKAAADQLEALVLLVAAGSAEDDVMLDPALMPADPSPERAAEG